MCLLLSAGAKHAVHELAHNDTRVAVVPQLVCF